MRKLTEQNMEQLLDQYSGVIYQSLKKMSVYKTHPDFEDFYQLGCIKLFEAYQTCAVDPLEEEHRYQFVNFAGQKCRWAFLDEKRKEKYVSERMEFHSDEILENEALLESFEEDIAFYELLKKLTDQLTLKELTFLKERFYLGLTITEIAQKYDVSRKTVYQWRNKVQEKAHFVWSGQIIERKG